MAYKYFKFSSLSVNAILVGFHFLRFGIVDQVHLNAEPAFLGVLYRTFVFCNQGQDQQTLF